jgi:hypothetical protein
MQICFADCLHRAAPEAAVTTQALVLTWVNFDRRSARRHTICKRLVRMASHMRTAGQAQRRLRHPLERMCAPRVMLR